MRVVRTAVNPLLWLVGLVTPLSLVNSALAGSLWISVALFVLACFPVAFAIVAYLWYMFRDPDRLQSAEYRIRRTALEILYSKKANPDILKSVREIARYGDLPGADGDPR